MQTIQLRSSLKSDSSAAAVKGEAWIDIEAADVDGRLWLARESGLDDEIVRRLLEPAPASCWRRFSQGLHVHLRASVPGPDTSGPGIIDLDLWLDRGRVITVRHGPGPALDRAAAACSTGSGPGSSWELIVFVVSEGLRRMEENLHGLAATLDQLEDEILSGEGAPSTHQLADLQKRLASARRFRMALANVSGFMSAERDAVTDSALRDEIDEIVRTVAQQWELLGMLIDRASALQDQIRDQLAHSMNSATYRFTWVATVFLPLSFLTGLLGINVAGIPGDHDPLAFWLVCGALSVVAAAWGITVGRISSPSGRRRGPRDPR